MARVASGDGPNSALLKMKAVLLILALKANFVFRLGIMCFGYSEWHLWFSDYSHKKYTEYAVKKINRYGQHA